MPMHRHRRDDHHLALSQEREVRKTTPQQREEARAARTERQPRGIERFSRITPATLVSTPKSDDDVPGGK